MRENTVTPARPVEAEALERERVKKQLARHFENLQTSIRAEKWDRAYLDAQRLTLCVRWLDLEAECNSKEA